METKVERDRAANYEKVRSFLGRSPRGPLTVKDGSGTTSTLI